MTDKHKKILVSGLQGSGKTNLILSLLSKSKIEGRGLGAFKPFDKGLLAKNATESATDAELFAALMEKEPMTTLITPYMAHESYPLEMSYRREGIKVDFEHVRTRLQVLCQTYSQVWIELPESLMSPLVEGRTVLDWAKEQKAPLVHVINPMPETFGWELAEINALVESGLELYMVINNPNQPQDADYLFYLWETIEKQTGLQIEGMHPHLIDADDETRIEALAKHLPNLTDRFL